MNARAPDCLQMNFVPVTASVSIFLTMISPADTAADLGVLSAESVALAAFLTVAGSLPSLLNSAFSLKLILAVILRVAASER